MKLRYETMNQKRLSPIQEHLARLIGHLKRIGGQFYTKNLCYLHSQNIGEYTYGFPNILSFGDGKIKIGKYCQFANDVTILLGGEHHGDYISTYPFDKMGGFKSKVTSTFCKGSVEIGNDVWIGQGVTILSGVKIGDGAIIGAGSIVTKDVPAYSIGAGVPLRVIKKRFNDQEISKLEKIKWWNWSHEKVQNFLPLITSSNIEQFLTRSNHE